MNMEQYSVPCIYPKLRNKIHKAPYKVSVPGSKSITNRALLLGTLAQGTTTLEGVLFSDDSRHFMECVKDLGFDTKIDEGNKTVIITGLGGDIPKKEASIYVGSAGTAARFLTAYLGVSNGSYYLDASNQMKKRPMAPLLSTLKEAGCEIQFEEKEGYFPYTLSSHGFLKDHLSVDIKHSSQFLSALMIASPLAKAQVTLDVIGTHGMSYIHITQKMMEQFGVTCQQINNASFIIPQNQHYKARVYQIEPDASAAAYFFALAAILNVPVEVENITLSSMQGDIHFLNLLKEMGCSILETPNSIQVFPPADGILQGIIADMSSCSDQAITLAALAPFANSKTVIHGISHIRFQECNRMNAIVTELRKMNIICEETEDSITIYPGTPTPSLVETYEDHRMAMGFALIGLKCEGIIIKDPNCCKKTFENYFQTLEDFIQKVL